MDFAYFDRISKDEAARFLSAFLSEEERHSSLMLQDAAKAHVPTARTISSIPQVLRWALPQIRVRRKAPDPEVPQYIRETSSYKEGLFEYESESRLLVLRCAYFFGSCFICSYSRLYWAIGSPESALRNMPVVVGFPDAREELAAILVTNNLIRRGIRGGGDAMGVESAVDAWAKRAAG